MLHVVNRPCFSLYRSGFFSQSLKRRLLWRLIRARRFYLQKVWSADVHNDNVADALRVYLGMARNALHPAS